MEDLASGLELGSVNTHANASIQLQELIVVASSEPLRWFGLGSWGVHAPGLFVKTC